MMTVDALRRMISRTACAAIVCMISGRAVFAQRAVTVAGHVSLNGAPLAGAHVRVDELGIDRVTNADGRYSFLVPAARVRGQGVKVVATMSDRRIKYVPQSAIVVLAGESIIQDFQLTVATPEQSLTIAADSAAQAPPTTGIALPPRGTIELGDLGAGTNLEAVLIGRYAGLDVRPASTPGGSAQIVYRGPRSALAQGQPLFVVDGIEMNNTVFASSAQRFGVGGFDYGSPISELDLNNVASIRVLTSAEASARYGGRGANGVVVVITNNGAEGPHFAVTASHRQTSASYVKLPELQNKYGQGLDGQFQFFDGKGGGVNDAVDQNWGPALDGRPITQASYLESGRGDVRLWLPKPNNVADYFSDASVAHTTASVQGRKDFGSLRASVSTDGTNGITPRDKLRQNTASLGATFHPNTRFDLALNAFGTQATHDDAAGTGVGEANPVFQFLRMGRQVDASILERVPRDTSDKQISWIYTTHNNPYFESLLGSNYSRRFRTAFSGSATYALDSSVSITARGGTDAERDGRLFRIPTGWMGGFPFYAGAGVFSRGGSEGDMITARSSNAEARVDARRTLSGGTRWTMGAGADIRSTSQSIHTAGVDSAASGTAAPVNWSGSSSATSLFGETGFAFSNGASIQAALRDQMGALLGGQSQSVILPSVRGSLDLTHVAPSIASSRIFSSATLTGAWWMDAPAVSPYAVQTMYAGSVNGSIAPTAGASAFPSSLKPEVTNGFQIGGDWAFNANGLGFGVAYYHENTSDLILPVASGAAFVATNAGSISNQGIEGRATARIGDSDRGLAWRIDANASKNSNKVESLASGATALALGPSQFGVSVQAQPGQPLGVLVGLRLRRDASGALLLSNGLPVADSAAGPQVLGVGQPSWSFGLGNTLRYRWVSVSALADARVGGRSSVRRT